MPGRRSHPRCLIDLSAWARSSHPAVGDRWADLLENDQLLCHPVFVLELLHNATGPVDYQTLRRDLEAAFEWVYPIRETHELALQMQQRMATGSPAGQRVKTADLLTAALAVQHRLGVIHYDVDYDRIAERSNEPLQGVWLAERGSLEHDAELDRSARKSYRRALGERLVLQDDKDLELWPELLEWVDQELRRQGVEPPAPLSVPTSRARRPPGRRRTPRHR